MILTEKIIQIYPELAGEPFYKFNLEVRNDSDGKGDYIKFWNHPTLKQPTQEELDAI